MEEILSLEISSAAAQTALYKRLREDAVLVQLIRSTYRKILGSEVGSCTNCLFDAIVHLQSLIKKNPLIKNRMEKELQYQVRAGAVLKDVVNYDAGKILTAANVTEELALYHLSTNPNCRKYFTEFPEDVEKKIEEYKAKSGKKASQKAAEQAEKEAAEKAKQEQAEKEAEEEADRERLEQEAQEKVAAEAAEKAAQEAKSNIPADGKLTPGKGGKHKDIL